MTSLPDRPTNEALARHVRFGLNHPHECWSAAIRGQECVCHLDARIATLDTLVSRANEADALRAEVERLRAVLVVCAIPYEALRMDDESRKWIAPSIWQRMIDATDAARAALAPTPEKAP